MGSFRFWQQWLLWASVSTVGLGLLLMAVQTGFVPGFVPAVNRTLWGSEVMPQEVVTYHRFVHAVLGATIAGWGVVLAFVARYPFREREPWAWWAATLSLLAWFVLDTAMSLYYGVWPNALFNLAALVLLGTPLVFTRRAFAARGRPPA